MRFRVVEASDRFGQHSPRTGGNFDLASVREARTSIWQSALVGHEGVVHVAASPHDPDPQSQEYRWSAVTFVGIQRGSRLVDKAGPHGWPESFYETEEVSPFGKEGSQASSVSEAFSWPDRLPQEARNALREFLKQVRSLQALKYVYFYEEEGFLCFVPVVDTPSDDEEEIYEAERIVASAFPNVPLYFDLLNLADFPDDVELDEVVPGEAVLVFAKPTPSRRTAIAISSYQRSYRMQSKLQDPDIGLAAINVSGYWPGEGAPTLN